MDKDIIFLEFKSSKIKNVTDIHSFQNKLTKEKDKFCQNITMKFTSSLFWLWACKGNEKDIYYYLLIENDYMDARIRKAFRNKISRQLPHNYESYSNIKRKIISGFQVTSLDEWNKEFPQYIIKFIT